MNKKYIYSLCAASFLMTACDYNEDNFPGFDQEPITDVVYYEGDFTGKYPTEGYFSLVQGDEHAGKATIEEALVSMLEDTYPYCDKGSSAKIKVKVADVMPSQEKEPAYKDAYELGKDDYDSMGTEKGQPGKYDNFDKNMDVNAYLTAFCNTKYADKAEGFICKITYKYYAGTTTNQSRYYKKGANGWTEEPLIPYDADKKYSLVSDDYKAMGTDDGEPGSNDEFTSVEQADACLVIFLKNKYTYVAKDGLTVEVNYKVAGANKTTVYRYNGSTWEAYNPKNSVVVSINERITVMKFDGKEWKLSNLISNIEKLTLTNAEYTKLVEWVKTNKPEYMSTQNTTSEYYFGADCGKNNNINNKYSTWAQYYNVDGYLDNLKDEEIQTIMDERLAKEAFPIILLPDMVANPDPDTSYTVIYKVYSGRGNGNYAMSFYYSKEDNTYTWDEMTPVMQ